MKMTLKKVIANPTTTFLTFNLSLNELTKKISPLLESALKQKSGKYKAMIISQISISSISCHIQKNGTYKKYELDLNSWTIKSNATTYSWGRNIYQNDRKTIENLITGHFLQNSKEWESILALTLQNITPNFKDLELENNISIDSSELKINQNAER